MQSAGLVQKFFQMRDEPGESKFERWAREIHRRQEEYDQRTASALGRSTGGVSLHSDVIACSLQARRLQSFELSRRSKYVRSKP